MINNQLLSLNSLIVQAEGIIVSDMDGEKVMMSINNGKYYNLGEIGSVIWDSIESPIIVNELINKLLKTYDVQELDCKKQVLAFLENLMNENIIQIEEKVPL